MKLYFTLEEIEKNEKGCAVALGTFDGLHIGHMEIIEDTVKTAKIKGLSALVYTFSNHPRELLTPENPPAKIMEIEEKIQILTHAGVDELALFKFDAFQMNIEPEDFVKSILVDRINMKHLTVGYDYRFGKNAKGTATMLVELGKIYGYSCEVVQPIMRNEVRVSSTLIRKLLEQGRIEEANFYLGRRHFIRGLVVRGKGKGKEFGFPTANLKIKENVSTICSGVYITETKIGDQFYPSATNVGYNPTVEDTGLHMETYIEGIDRPLYDEVIEVHFVKRLRNEMKFRSVEELIEAMNHDIMEMKRYFDLQT